MIDRDSERLGQMGYFDERDPAVKRIIAHLIKAAHENGCTVSICGEGPSNLPDFAEFLVRVGIDSISVNNDAVVQTRKHVASVEQKIILERLAEQAAIAAGNPSRSQLKTGNGSYKPKAHATSATFISFIFFIRKHEGRVC